MTPEKLIATLLSQRETKVEVEPGKLLVVRRPAETQMLLYRRVTAEAAIDCVVGWEGITEADVLGASIGASDPATFSSALCRELMLDRSRWCEAVARTVIEQIATHLQATEAVEKN